MYPPSKTLSKKFLIFVYLTATLPIIGLFFIYFFGSIMLFKLAVIGIALGTLGFFFFVFPKVSLYLAIFYIYSGLSYYFQLHVAYPIVVIAVVAVVFRLLGGGTAEFPCRSFNWSMAFFTLIALTSMLYAHDPDRSLVGFGIYLKVLVLTYLAVQLLKTPKDIERFVFIVFLGALLSVLYGLLNLKLGMARSISRVGFAQIMRFEGTHFTPNRLAMYLVSALPLGFYAVKCAPRISFRILSGLGVLLLILTTFATYSRAAIVSLAFILLATIFREVKSKKLYLGIAALITVGLLLTPSYYWIRISTLGDVFSSIPSDRSIYLRFKAAESAIQLISQHPFMGVGLNNYFVRSAAEFATRIVAHNAYLEIFVGVGMFGFIAYMGLFVSGMWECVRGMRARWEPQFARMGSLSYYILVSIIASMISGLFNSCEFAYFLWIPLIGGLVIGNAVGKTVPDR